MVFYHANRDITNTREHDLDLEGSEITSSTSVLKSRGWVRGKAQSLGMTRMEGLAIFKVRSQTKMGIWICARISESLYANSGWQNGTVGQKYLQHLLDCVMKNQMVAPYQC